MLDSITNINKVSYFTHSQYTTNIYIYAIVPSVEYFEVRFRYSAELVVFPEY